MIVDGHRQDLLGPPLPDHVTVELVLDGARRRDARNRRPATATTAFLLVDNRLAQFYAFAADVDVAGPFDERPDVAMTLAAERAVCIPFPAHAPLRFAASGISAISVVRHDLSPMGLVGPRSLVPSQVRRTTVHCRPDGTTSEPDNWNSDCTAVGGSTRDRLPGMLRWRGQNGVRWGWWRRSFGRFGVGLGLGSVGYAGQNSVVFFLAQLASLVHGTEVGQLTSGVVILCGQLPISPALKPRQDQCT